MQERAHDAVFVETDDCVQLGSDDLGQTIRVVTTAGVHAPRVETRDEELDEPAGEMTMRGKGRFDVTLAEQCSGLTEVFAVRAQKCNLAPREAGAEHELVEAI